MMQFFRARVKISNIVRLIPKPSFIYEAKIARLSVDIRDLYL